MKLFEVMSPKELNREVRHLLLDLTVVSPGPWKHNAKLTPKPGFGASYRFNPGNRKLENWHSEGSDGSSITILISEPFPTMSGSVGREFFVIATGPKLIRGPVGSRELTSSLVHDVGEILKRNYRTDEFGYGQGIGKTTNLRQLSGTDAVEQVWGISLPAEGRAL